MLKCVLLCLISGVIINVTPLVHIVDLPNGAIRGAAYTTEKNTHYYAFRGIPYAAPPIGNLRFKPPVHARQWSEVLNVTSDSKICYQIRGGFEDVIITDERESEDCLYLNVYAPQTNLEKKLPVLFFIHGGGFMAGHSSHKLYGPDYFLDQQIIFVSFNYRLGAFGFMSTGDNVIRGNMGLRDQLHALKWVNSNIHLFGGDKEKITIFGQGAGGASVIYHIISPLSKGLFRAAIASSGTALNPWSLQRNPRKQALDTATYIDKTFKKGNKTSEEILMLLQSVSDVTLAHAAKEIAGYSSDKNQFLEDARNVQPLNQYHYAPILEEPFPNSFISNYMFVALDKGKINKVPVLLGFTSEEGLKLIENPQFFHNLQYSWDKDIKLLVPPSLHLDNDENKTFVGNDIKKLYCENKSFVKEQNCVIRIATDTIIRGMEKTAQFLQRQITHTYLYEFTYSDTTKFKGIKNVPHFADMFYLFKIYKNSSKTLSETDITTRNRLVKMWSNFIKHLNPTPKAETPLENVIWSTVGKNPDVTLRYLDIGKHLMIKSDPRNETIFDWEIIFAKFGFQPYSTY